MQEGVVVVAGEDLGGVVAEAGAGFGGGRTDAGVPITRAYPNATTPGPASVSYDPDSGNLLGLADQGAYQSVAGVIARQAAVQAYPAPAVAQRENAAAKAGDEFLAGTQNHELYSVNVVGYVDTSVPTYSNVPGRVELYANTADLTGSTLNAGNFLALNVTNFAGNSENNGTLLGDNLNVVKELTANGAAVPSNGDTIRSFRSSYTGASFGPSDAPANQSDTANGVSYPPGPVQIAHRYTFNESAAPAAAPAAESSAHRDRRGTPRRQRC